MLALFAARGAEAADAAVDAPKAALSSLAEPEAPRGTVVTIAYTSNVGGEYERCGCAIEPLGGLARRAAELARIRRQSDAVVSVDAGDLFLPADGESGEEVRAPGAVERRARLLATAYARMGVAAFTPGERDLALGVPTLRRLLGDAKVPIVSANLVDAQGRLLFEPDRLIDAAGVKIGIFGVTAASSPDPDRWRAWGAVVNEPVAAARAAVASLRARGARVVIALVHVGGPADSRRVIAAVPGIDWVVLGHSGRNLETPELVATELEGGAGARELEAMSLGRNLGRLDLHFVSPSGPFVDRDERPRQEAIRLDHEQQLADYKARLAAPSDPKTRAYAEERVESLDAALARDARALAALSTRITGNWFQNWIVPMDKSLPDDPGMHALVERYERAAQRAKKRAR